MVRLSREARIVPHKRILQRDNAPSPQRFPSRSFGQKSIVVLGHPAYWSDVSPCGFFLFLVVYNYLMVSYFETEEEIQIVMMASE
jgi:hypothetical protein